MGSLGGEVVSIEREVTALIDDMNLSIREADNFIKNQIVKFQEPLDLIIADEYFGH